MTDENIEPTTAEVAEAVDNGDVIDIPSDVPVDSPDETDHNGDANTDGTQDAAGPVEHAVFAAETDPATITTPHDPTPEDLNPLADEEAVFRAADNNPEPAPVPVDAAPSSVDDSAAGVRGDSGVVADGERLPVTDFPRATNVEDDPMHGTPAEVEARAYSGFITDEADLLHELNVKVDRILEQFESIASLITEVGPTLEALMEEAKSKGLSGLLPLLFSLRK